MKREYADPDLCNHDGEWEDYRPPETQCCSLCGMTVEDVEQQSLDQEKDEQIQGCMGPEAVEKIRKMLEEAQECAIGGSWSGASCAINLAIDLLPPKEPEE